MKILAETTGHLEELKPEAFGNERYLQEILAQFPDLVLAGVADDQPRSIWTLGFEVSVPSGSIDLLLMDSSGHVWVVETKLDKNPEVRKQVVGQVLAYASDVASWSRGELEEKVAAYLSNVAYEHLHHRLSPTLHGFLVAGGLGRDVADELIDTAVTRLNRGDLTALVVVDEVNVVLRRLVEFVNAHSAFELLALKVEVVRHAGSRLFVPTVIGVTADTESEKEGDYLSLIASAPERVREAERLLDALAAERGWQLKVVKRSKGYFVSGAFLFRLYPNWDCIMFDLSRLHDRNLHAEAEQVRELVAELSGKPQPVSEVTLGTQALLDQWNRFRTGLVPTHEAAVQRSL